MLVAAQHLEGMKSELPDLQQLTGNECEVQMTYLLKKLGQTQETITELTDEILCFRIEQLEQQE